jgi:SAM-dependent methyltransferase
MRGYEANSYGDGFADVYDQWYPEPADTAAAVATLARLAGPGPVLELGVGTGRLAIPLAATGLVVHGLDASAAMLEQLAAKPGGDQVVPVQADMAGSLPDGLFSLVFVALNTFFALLSEPRQRQCVATVATRLEPSGRFVVEAFVPSADTRSGSYVDVRAIEADRVVLTVSTSDAAAQRTDGQFVELAQGQPVRLRPFALRWATPDQLDSMARTAGLELEHRWAGWDGGAFDADSSSHVSVYRRR